MNLLQVINLELNLKGEGNKNKIYESKKKKKWKFHQKWEDVTKKGAEDVK